VAMVWPVRLGNGNRFGMAILSFVTHSCSGFTRACAGEAPYAATTEATDRQSL
jgi:hypothetical protein